ncbi:MAG: MBL fold metallo-hydrolase [Oscillospiraceae bacterium]|nr:MBL fold metallo-hydrolase [Oscillospiraceae bacterium]
MKKRSWRLLSLLAALFMVLCFALTGCSGESGPETPPDETEEPNWYDRVYDPAAAEGKFSIYFVNAARDYVTDASVTHAGDCTILVSPEGKAMMIDVGNQTNGVEAVAALQALGIDTLEYLMFSHPHVDHIGGYNAVFRYITVKEIVKNAHDYSASSGVYAAMIRDAEALNIPFRIVHEGDTLMLGEEVELHIMNPPEDFVYDDTSATGNNASILMRAVYGASSFMTGGDLYAAQEQVLVEKYGSALQTDVVKINHHGYDSSSTREWVQAESCKIAGGEAGGVNSETVLGRYRVSGALPLYTCLDGAIAVHTAGDSVYEVQVERERTVVAYGKLTELDGYSEGHFIIS